MILQFLLNYFLSEYKDGEFKPLYDLLEQNGFDLFSALKNAKPETFAPLIRAFFQKTAKENSTSEEFSFEGATPIENFADREIVSSLNAYFSMPD